MDSVFLLLFGLIGVGITWTGKGILMFIKSERGAGKLFLKGLLTITVFMFMLFNLIALVAIKNHYVQH